MLSHIESIVCSDLPHAFWDRKKHIVDLPYKKDLREKQIPTKASPIQMNRELLQYCQKEIKDLLDKGLIRKSKNPPRPGTQTSPRWPRPSPPPRPHTARLALPSFPHAAAASTAAPRRGRSSSCRALFAAAEKRF